MTESAPTSGIRAEFRLPDLTLPFPPPAPRPDGDRLRAETCDRALRRGVLGPRGHQRLMTGRNLDLGVALTGAAEPGRARVVLDWFLWVLLLDDRIDDGPWAQDGMLAAFTESALAIVRGVPDPAHRAHDDEPMLADLAGDLWPRTAALADAAWRHRFGEHLARHLWAQCDQVERRTAGKPMEVRGYVAARRDLFGADLFFDLMEAADGRVLSARERPAVLRASAADVLAWTNDVYSLEKDLAFGEPANLVCLLRDERGGSWQDAVDAAHRMIVERAGEFRSARRAADPAYAGRLADVLAASLDWHRSVPRYHWQAAERVDTRQSPPSLLWPSFETDPYALYERLRDDFPLVRDEPLDAWLVSRHADVRAALTEPRLTPRNYAWQLAPMFGPTVLQMEGREHAAHRAFLTPAFRGRALDRLAASVRATAERLAGDVAARIADGDDADLVEAFTRRLPIDVVVRALGLPAEDAPLFQDWYRAGFSYLGNYRQDPATLARGLTSRDELYAYLEPHVAERRARPADDLLSVLCTVRVDGELLPDSMVKGFCGALLGAGGETTDRALASLLANLLQAPHVLAELRADPGLAGAVWAESLRRNPPVHVVLRQADGPVDLPCGRVPDGATVACLVGSANRDPRRFEDPDRFDPRRSAAVEREFTGASTHLAFGAGRHFCLGAQLARMEAEIAVTVLLERLPDLRWADGFAPVETGLLTRAPDELLVAAR
ncbi:Pulcherriminic acid synthase [Actinomadura rubteroloni]|uniref:Pulcherriminic acid synthase n=1 Tax=Actinomadura rubteroloni TaxID=1926885 RepID=A0A2P4UBX6_9ACTN|nr:cytochrome P450 [Actinomadura rubteroloni]POM22549.1 Pulcherriminic acid synthase [Actinomadura rubteroloni]